MKALPEFQNQRPAFWASVRSLGQQLGYSRKGAFLRHTPTQMAAAFEKLGLNPLLIKNGKKATALGANLERYFSKRAEIMTNFVEPRLMTLKRARETFVEFKKQFSPSCPLPYIKQKGKMKTEAYLTCLVNMLIEQNAAGQDVNFNPLKLVTFTGDGKPIMTMSRRMDGAFPSTVNPVALWEIKEYYHNKSFGSRVAGGVYETILDGIELKDFRENAGRKVAHLLIVDSRTWWDKGKSYLCRIFDLLHMGYADEVLFGYEVVERLPKIASAWVKAAKKS